MTLAEKLKQRTKQFAINIVLMCRKLPKQPETPVIRYQLIKSATSVAANYRAVCRARSDNEFYAKICIVVEEADETVFWLELIESLQLCVESDSQPLLKEGNELLSIFAKSKKTIQQKLNK